MVAAEKTQLLDLLSSSHNATQIAIEGVNLETVVYQDPVWQIRDVIWHIAVWDRQVTKSIRAFIEGSEYAIPDFDENAFNKESIIEGRKLKLDQVLLEWNQARSGFKEAVQESPPEKIFVDLLYPWGDERGAIAQLVKYMVEHDAEHRTEIAAVLARG
jgi:hypothetical protein